MLVFPYREQNNLCLWIWSANVSIVSNLYYKCNYRHLCAVETDEIKRLSRSFKRLDLNQNGSLSADEFLAIPELQQNPLVRRVIDILDTDRNGEVDFQGEQQKIICAS